jgi:hypothetical protein
VDQQVHAGIIDGHGSLQARGKTLAYCPQLFLHTSLTRSIRQLFNP